MTEAKTGSAASEACPAQPAPSSAVDLDELRQLEILAGLPDDQLRWLLDHGRVQDVPEGELYVHVGDPATDMFIVLSGRSEWRVDVGSHKVLFNVAEAGSVGGLLPFSRMTEYGGDAQAVEPTRLLRVPKECLDELVAVSPVLAQRLVAVMSNRVREATRTEQQRERMAALGKLAAGLAHELNNPAAAIVRSTQELGERLARLPGQAAKLVERGVDPKWVRSAASSCRVSAGKLSALERSTREDEITDWLDELGMEEPWMSAETFVQAGFELEKLRVLVSELDPDAAVDLLAWLEGILAAAELEQEIRHAAGRVSSLVGSVKQYSHLDRAADLQPVDIHRGLDDTLTMLGHRIRKEGVRVETRYAELPEVHAHPGELNQVWTNLIDNALDALAEVRGNSNGEAAGGGGRLEIETCDVGGAVEVRVIDDGAGIPEEVRARIFEPFFTTKGVGQGTGLGLDIVRRIVSQHKGEIRAEGERGRTVMSVRLPVANAVSQE